MKTPRGSHRCTRCVHYPNNELDINETVTIALVAMCTFSVLDYFAPSMAGAARLGAGGIGANLVGSPVVRPVDVTHN
jgi:hypothetical protein